MKKNSKTIPLFRHKTTGTSVAVGTPRAGAVDDFGNLWVTVAGSGGAAAVVAAASSAGATLVVEPGQWSVFSVPASATQPVATQAASLTARNVARSISATLNATAAQPSLLLELFDVTGATVLWSVRLGPLSAGSTLVFTQLVEIPGLSTNSAMTLRLSAAPAATNFGSVALTGFIAPA